MATYPEICNATAEDSGTVPGSGTLISTVSGQVGLKADIVRWVADAYTRIQSSRPDWRFLRAEFSGSTVVNTRRYNSGAMGITERFGEWALLGGNPAEMFSVYLPADGQGQERFLPLMQWDQFYKEYLFGSNAAATGEPAYISIDPEDNLAVWPLPDDAYTIRGRYHKSPQILAANDDTPEMPARFHDAIKYRALMFLATFDEAAVQYQLWEKEFDRIMDQLVDAETPKMTHGPPLC